MVRSQIVKFKMTDPKTDDQHTKLRFIVNENPRLASISPDPSHNTDRGLLLLVYHRFKI